MRLRLLFDGTLQPGDYLQARDGSIATCTGSPPGDAPATLLNFNIRGYETETVLSARNAPARAPPAGRDRRRRAMACCSAG